MCFVCCQGWASIEAILAQPPRNNQIGIATLASHSDMG